MPAQVTAIVKAIEAGFNLWKTYISTRQESYNRQMDKRKRLAIDYAENFIRLFKDYKHTTDNKEKDKINDKMAYFEKKFFRLNQ